MHAERLLWSIYLPSLVLIAQAVFLLECGQVDRQTNKQTRLNALPTPATIQTAWVINFTLLYHNDNTRWKVLWQSNITKAIAVFFDRYFHIPLPIVTKHELGLPFPSRLGTFAKNLVQIRPQFFSYRSYRQTDRQTDTETYAGKNIFPRFRGNNYVSWSNAACYSLFC